MPSPDQLAALSLRYQVAQKVHAVTDPHDPPTIVNDRARDVVDLLLLRDLAEASGQPRLVEVRAAVEDVFAARAHEALVTGGTPRAWPTRVVAHAHWGPSFKRAADSAGVSLSLPEAVGQVNRWLERIEQASDGVELSQSGGN